MAIIIGLNKDEWYLYKSTTITRITKHYGDVDEMNGDGGDAAVADEDRFLSLLDLRRMKMYPLVDKFPLQIPSGGEVSTISGLSVCRLSSASS